jgi:hypothetical protein
VPDSGQENTSFDQLLRELTRKSADSTASARSAEQKRGLPGASLDACSPGRM